MTLDFPDFIVMEHFHPLLRSAKAVLFDAGGTLVHPDWQRLVVLAEGATRRVLAPAELRRALVEALRDADAHMRRGNVLPPDTRLPGWLFRHMFRALGLEDEECQRLSVEIEASHNTRHLWCGLDEEAPEVLTTLKQHGLKVGVISNTEDGRLEELLQLVDLHTHFDLMIDSHVVKERKPEPAIFHLALKQLNVTVNEAVYIGDSYGHDVLGARAAGLSAILVDALNLYEGIDCPRITRLSELVNSSDR